MLWELEQAEIRLREIEKELARLDQDTGLSTKKRREQRTALEQEQFTRLRDRDRFKSIISQDRALSKALDARRTAEAAAKRTAPRPQAELGVPETPGQPSGPVPERQALYAAFAKQWHERSVADRANASAKLLESEREEGWEP